ncbi:hypothetical protein [Mycoplasmoides alvi]|uniref:hypothetical protein n=1 Tax=Mycoplasmoides alvi TaxID=78580 RepID=UPI00051B2C1B|nr:hypothetical protein [Mycoplasmoides alvi]
MEFLSKKDQKKYKGILSNSISRKGKFLSRKLTINYVTTTIKVNRIRYENDLLEYCGLKNEYNYDNIYIMLAKKFTNTMHFRLPYAIIYCSVNWKINKIEIVRPNAKINFNNAFEYVFIMAPNLIKYFNLNLNDTLRTSIW